MTVVKELEPERRAVPAPIVFGDEPADEVLSEFAEFAEGEATAPTTRPDGWASLAGRRLRSVSGEDALD